MFQHDIFDARTMVADKQDAIYFYGFQKYDM